MGQLSNGPPRSFCMRSYAHLVAETKQRKRRRRDAITAPLDERGVASLSEDWTQPGRIVLASANDTRFTYWLLPDRPSALFCLASLPAIERQWFYMIEADRPIYAYLDFDCGATAAYTADSWAAAVRLCAVLFTGFVAATYARFVSDAGWRFYDASTDSKWSAHAHSRIVFANVADLKDAATRFHAWLRCRRAARDPLVMPLFFARRNDAACIFDHAVYTERPFRLPLNRKKLSATNFLRPAYGTPPLASQQEEIGVGFLHPDDPATPTLPRLADLLAARRRITAILRPVGDISAQIDAAVRAVWTGELDAPPIVQEPVQVMPAMRRALISAAGGIIEIAAFHMHRGEPLSNWDGRAAVLQTAQAMLPDMIGSLAGTLFPLDVCVVTSDFTLAFAFVALILYANAWLADGAADIDAWMAADGHAMPEGFAAAAAFDALRRDAPAVLPIPENAVTVDCMCLAARSPFDRGP